MSAVKTLLGDLTFWTSSPPLSRRGWARLLLFATGLGLFAFRRLLQTGHQFVGNDADLPMRWMWQLRFTRLWQYSGVNPWWNPFGLLGAPNSYGPTHPFSLLNTFQRLFPFTEKGLDYTLVALALVLILTTAALLVRLRFSPLASLLGGLLLGCTGLVVTQLFAGHLPLYACFCLTSALALSLLEGLRRSQLPALLPATLLTAGLFLSADFQGAYLVLWTVSVFFLLRAALGSPEAIPAPTIWTCLRGEARPGNLLSSAPPRKRAEEVLWTALKLATVVLMGALLSACVWLPTLALQTPPPDTGLIYPHSAPPLAWLTLIIPHFFLGDGQYYSWTGWAQWEGQPGMGVTSLLVILLGLGIRRRRDLALPATLLGLAALLAAGKFTPFPNLYAVLDPWAGQFEVPSRFYLGVNFAYTLLFAWGLDSLAQARWELSPRWATALARAVTGLLLIGLLTFYMDGTGEIWQMFINHLQNGYSYSGLKPVDARDYYTLTWIRFSAVCGMAALMAYCLLRQPLRRRPWLMTALLLLDITRFNYPYANMRAHLDFQVPASAYEIMQQYNLKGRISNTYQITARGTFSLLRHSEWDALWQPDLDWENLGLLARKMLGQQADFGFPTALSRFFGVNLFYYPQEWLETEIRGAFVNTTNYVAQDDPQAQWAFALDAQARPLVYLSRAPEPARSPRAMLQNLKEHPDRLGEFRNFVDPSTLRQISERLRVGQWTQTDLPDRVEILQEEPNRTEVGCQLSAPALVILNQAWDPDWTVSVDGMDVPCLPCQCGFNRGVLVDGGEHRILFQYNPKLAQRGLRLSWVSLVLMTLSLALMLLISQLLKWLKDSHE